jgi:acyl-CoA reductase-like NAD-dependent aldehyde dehydrogenase
LGNRFRVSLSVVAPFYIAGQAETSAATLAVHHPFDGRQIGETAFATEEQVERAIVAAESAAKEVSALPAATRAAALDHVSARLTERADEVARLITAENGKPLKWARFEVTRGISTFRWAAEEARRWSGTLQRLDTDAAAAGRLALVNRVPRGSVLGISPFNFPLNLVAHKIAPAIAVGAPILLKPAPATPLTALLLGEFLAETDLPAGAFSIVPIPNDRAPALVADPRLPVVSFTGSGPVGWQIRDAVPRKHVTLELGGNAAVLVGADWDDLDWAATRIATFSNYQAGQSCIAVQRVFVHADHYDALAKRLVDAVAAQRTGDPNDEATDVGPMISEDAAKRVETWVGEALSAGPSFSPEVAGTEPVSPTVMTDVPADAKVASEEVFGPVLVLSRVETDEAGLAAINDSDYGLQAGVFTRRLDLAFRAHKELEVGGVIVGDVPSFRADQMPYGGVKGSGIGREGLASAMEDYTEPRIMVLTGLAL